MAWLLTTSGPGLAYALHPLRNPSQASAEETFLYLLWSATSLLLGRHGHLKKRSPGTPHLLQHCPQINKRGTFKQLSYTSKGTASDYENFILPYFNKNNHWDFSRSAVEEPRRSGRNCYCVFTVLQNSSVHLFFQSRNLRGITARFSSWKEGN